MYFRPWLKTAGAAVPLEEELDEELEDELELEELLARAAT